MLFYQYLPQYNVRPVLEAVDKPSVPMENLKDPLEAGLRHEEYVTRPDPQYLRGGPGSQRFPHYPVPGLVCEGAGEEETNANDLITKMELFGSDPKSLYMLDNELKARVYAAPSLVL